MKYNDLTLGQIEAVVNKLGGMECLQRFLQDKLIVSEPIRSWHEQDDIIYFGVTSDGTTGKDWTTRLEKKGFRIGYHAKRVLLSPYFKPSNGVKTEVAVFRGSLFENRGRNTGSLRSEVDKHGFKKPNAEISCLIREKFTDEEIEAMGLRRIEVIHESNISFDHVPCLLGADRDDDGRWLRTIRDRTSCELYGFGFAYAMPSFCA